MKEKKQKWMRFTISISDETARQLNNLGCLFGENRSRTISRIISEYHTLRVDNVPRETLGENK